MVQLTNHHLNSYPNYSPNLAAAKMGSVSPNSSKMFSQTLQLLVLAVVTAGLAITGSRMIQARNVNLVAVPVPEVSEPINTNTSQPVVTSAVVEPTPVATGPDAKALQALLNKWQADYKAAKFGVVVTELSAAKRSASLNSHQLFEGASLYKLYLADYLYTGIYDGNLSLDSSLGTARTIGDCLRPMLVYSDNTCGETLGWAVGWTNLHSFVRASGFSETIMSPINAVTANDIAKYLDLLYKGNLIKGNQYEQQLLGYLKKQVYRSAIPAGVPGVVVADKTGSKINLWHDAAIVYGPKGDYILVVLSENSGSAPIKDLSTQVSNFFKK